MAEDPNYALPSHFGRPEVKDFHQILAEAVIALAVRLNCAHMPEMDLLRKAIPQRQANINRGISPLAP